MTDQSTDTKNKIMEVARILFANQGFEGTSVREIAKAADVNVASVNYHFTNKENLFSEIIRSGYVKCSDDIKSFYALNSPCVEESLIYLFRSFMERPHDLISYFKMTMSTQHCHHQASQGTDDQMIGPPGGKVIIDAIQQEVGSKVGEEDLHWALRCLFSHVVHQALMYNCCFKSNTIPFTSTEDIEKGIRRLTQVVLKDLKSS